MRGNHVDANLLGILIEPVAVVRATTNEVLKLGL